MKVRFLQSIAGARFGYIPGQVADVPREEAIPWIKSGVAEALESQAMETASVVSPRQALVPRGRPRGRPRKHPLRN